MTFGEAWKWGASKEESRKIFDKYAEAGGNFLDTANRYNAGQSEKYVGEFVASQRDRFVLATKYSLTMKAGDPNAHGNQRKNMVQALEASLRRLKQDYVDLYWVHAWDRMTPPDELMRGLDDLGLPHEFLQSEQVSNILYGGLLGDIDCHRPLH